MEDLGLTAAILMLGPVLLVALIYKREQEVYGAAERNPASVVMRAPCARCGAALVASELLYVVEGELLCESCMEAGGEAVRPLTGPELALLASRAKGGRATSRR
jgi:hypothetical protein